jgi:tRNA pseudouridine38-40 synthase
MMTEPVKIAGAGRTDSGVHASGQVVSFTTRRPFPFHKLCIALNSELPKDIGVRDVSVVPPPFSARFSALQRTYVFAIFNRREPSPLLARQAYHVWRPLDIEPMLAGAEHLIGEHDFRSFCGLLPEGGVTIRTVRRLDMERRGDMFRIVIAADGFLHRMVRTIVGTLVDCGAGLRDPAGVPAMLHARDRRTAGHTAPPNGLYLAGVTYEGGYDSYAEPPVFRW